MQHVLYFVNNSVLPIEVFAPCARWAIQGDVPYDTSHLLARQHVSTHFKRRCSSRNAHLCRRTISSPSPRTTTLLSILFTIDQHQGTRARSLSVRFGKCDSVTCSRTVTSIHFGVRRSEPKVRSPSSCCFYILFHQFSFFYVFFCSLCPFLCDMSLLAPSFSFSPSRRRRGNNPTYNHIMQCTMLEPSSNHMMQCKCSATSTSHGKCGTPLKRGSTCEDKITERRHHLHYPATSQSKEKERDTIESFTVKKIKGKKKKWKVRKKIKSKTKQNAMEVLSPPSPNSNSIQVDFHPVCAAD